jgi:hypothetical protein
MSLDLAKHTIQLLRWRPLLTCSAVVAAGCFVVGIGDEFDMAARFIVVRVSILVIAATLPFLIDDPSSAVNGPSPTPLRVRRAHRLTVAFLPWALCVGAVLMLAARNLPSDPDNPFPYARLLTEALALAVVACLIAALLGRRTAEPGRRAATLMIMAGVAIAAIPPPVQPWMTPFDPQYTGMSVTSWWLLIALVVVGFVAVSWDAQTRV